jgi:hypothetical protein
MQILQVMAQQITAQKQPDMAIEDSDEEEQIDRSKDATRIARTTGTQDGHRDSSAKMARASERMRKSMTSVKSAGLTSADGEDMEE